MPLRVSTIAFLNPAPLLYDFEHDPPPNLRARYDIHYTSPANCARELHAGIADLGLIPIAELTPELAIVPGCAIASLHDVRSILLLVKNPGGLPAAEALHRVATVAADSGSRSSTAYTHLLFERFYNTHPTFTEHRADPLAMLSTADAALLIGDPALLAREHRAEIEATLQPSQQPSPQQSLQQSPQPSPQPSQNPSLLWLDLAALWREHTGLPWVAAVWAVRPETLPLAGVTPEQLTSDLVSSRDHGLAHIDSLVREWTPRISLPAETIHTYLTQNIHYTLDPECLSAIELFRSLCAELGILLPLPKLNLLT